MASPAGSRPPSSRARRACRCLRTRSSRRARICCARRRPRTGSRCSTPQRRCDATRCCCAMARSRRGMRLGSGLNGATRRSRDTGREQAHPARDEWSLTRARAPADTLVRPVRAHRSGRRFMFRRAVNTLRLLAAIAVVAGAAAPALAIQRTFVASTGVDTNPCTLTLPCRGFAAAVAAVGFNGEVVVLDSAGYGPVTINKDVTLTTPKGVYAGVSVTSGTGITIASGGRVTLRGLTINGQGGSVGIDVQSASVVELYDVEISAMVSGLQALAGGVINADGLVVRESSSEGVHLQGGARLHLRNSRIDNNQRGVFAQGGSWFSAADTTFVGNYYEAIYFEA